MQSPKSYMVLCSDAIRYQCGNMYQLPIETLKKIFLNSNRNIMHLIRATYFINIKCFKKISFLMLLVGTLVRNDMYCGGITPLKRINFC